MENIDFATLFQGFGTMMESGYLLASARVFLILLGLLLIYLGWKGVLEPMVMIPMGLGMVAINCGTLFMPDGTLGNLFLDPMLSDTDDLMNTMQIDFLQPVYTLTFSNGLIACFVFMGIGTLLDVGFLLQKPFVSLFLALCAELGTFLTIPVASALGLTLQESASVAMVGGADGPMVLFTSLALAKHLFVPITVVAYLYLGLTYGGYPYLVKLLVPKRLRAIKMTSKKAPKNYDAKVKLAFSAVLCAVLCFLFPVASPLFFSLFLGVAVRESGMKHIYDFVSGPLLYGSTFMLGVLLGVLCDAHLLLDPKILKLLVLGMRGPGAVERFTHIPGTQIVALCDYEQSRAEGCQKYLQKASLPKAAVYSGEKGYEELCKRDDIDLVYIATDWLHHFPVAMCAMENGKHVAIEVPSAMNLQECWDLINMSEKTRKHCMILENCCYDWFEMNTLNMAQQGVFGEVIRGQGAYIHELSPFWDHYWKNGENDKLGWRLDYNKKHRGDVYATHGLGPVAQAFDIHRGDRMVTLVAMDTKSVVGKDLVEKRTGEKCDDFRNGDHTTTLIRTANGKVIEIQHNVMTPQPYNRLYQLTGTKGFANKYPIQGYALDAKQLSASGVEPQVDNLNTHSFLPKEEMEALVEKFQHPILKKYGEMAKEVGGH